MAEPLKRSISCIILAGGQARRMQGQDKGLVSYRGRPLIEHVLERVRPQVDDIIISANRNASQYAAYGTAVIADQRPGFAGPLAGIASCLPQCRHPLALVVACDMPQLPPDLVARLTTEIAEHELCIVSCKHRLQLALLLKTCLLDSINSALAHDQLKLMDWVAHCDSSQLAYENTAAFDNLNTLNDLKA